MKRRQLSRENDSGNEFGMEAFIAKIEEDLRIDEHKLEDELKFQPEMRHDVGKELAYAISRRDQIERDLKVLKAEVARDFRSGAAKENEKVTIGEVADAVILDKDVRRTEQALINAERDVKLLEATRDAVKDRGYALGRLTDLWLERYYDREGVQGSEGKLKNERAARGQEKLREAYREERRNRGK